MFLSKKTVNPSLASQQNAEALSQGEKAVDTKSAAGENVNLGDENGVKEMAKSQSALASADSTSQQAQLSADSTCSVYIQKAETKSFDWSTSKPQNGDSCAWSKAFLQEDSAKDYRSLGTSVWGDRVAGDTHPYILRNDDLVSSTLLSLFVACLLLAVYAKRYISNTMKHFFERKRHNTIFEDSDDAQMQGKGLLMLQTAVAMGILMFNHFQSSSMHNYERGSVLALLGINIAVCYILLLVKFFVCDGVNRTLFATEQCRVWREGLLFVINCAGLLLMPIALLSIYSQINVNTQLYSVILIGLISEIVLFYKTFRTFFDNGLGYLHLILYFCALEIIPYFILWSISTYANQIIIDL